MYMPWFQMGCLLTFNAQQTAAYLANSSDVCNEGDFRGSHSMTCDCPPLHWLIPDDGGDPVQATYTNPISDQAPWFDADIPESGKFLGFLISDVTMNSVASRQVSTRISSSGGGVLGPIRNKERKFDFTVLMFGCNESALEYGMRFLTDALASPGCDDGCTLCDAEFRDACPAVNGSSASLDVGRWILKNVGLVGEGPTWDTPPVEGMQCNVRRVKFSIASEYAWKFKCPVDVCIDLPLAQEDPWTPTCDNVEAFFCNDEYVTCSVTEPLIIGETAMIIKVQAGSLPLEHIKISVTPDKFGYECSPETAPNGYTPQTPCDEITIPYIPANTFMTYDTSIEEITVTYPGGGVVDGTPFISTVVGRPPTFPTVRCGQFCVKVSASECSVDDASTVSIQSVHREV